MIGLFVFGKPLFRCQLPIRNLDRMERSLADDGAPIQG